MSLYSIEPWGRLVEIDNPYKPGRVLNYTEAKVLNWIAKDIPNLLPNCILRDPSFEIGFTKYQIRRFMIFRNLHLLRYRANLPPPKEHGSWRNKPRNLNDPTVGWKSPLFDSISQSLVNSTEN